MEELYFAGNETFTWNRSLTFCESFGSSLASIHSIDEYNAMTGVCRNINLKQNTEIDCWTGLNDIDYGSQWKWSDGTSLSFGFDSYGQPLSELPWLDGEPNNANRDEDCVEIDIYNAPIYGFNDQSCTDQGYPICNAITDGADGDVRLFGGPYGIGDPIYQGRAEIFHGGEFGTICDDHFNDVDAQVLCRQLGYGSSSDYSSESTATGAIWLDEVACTGSELRIDECSHNDWGSHDCSHHEDVFVRCGNPFTTSPTLSPLDTNNPSEKPTSSPTASPTTAFPTSSPTASPTTAFPTPLETTVFSSTIQERETSNLITTTSGENDTTPLANALLVSFTSLIIIVASVVVACGGLLLCSILIILHYYKPKTLQDQPQQHTENDDENDVGDPRAMSDLRVEMDRNHNENDDFAALPPSPSSAAALLGPGHETLGKRGEISTTILKSPTNSSYYENMYDSVQPNVETKKDE